MFKKTLILNVENELYYCFNKNFEDCLKNRMMVANNIVFINILRPSFLIKDAIKLVSRN